MLRLLEGDDEVCPSQVEFQHLKGEAPGPGIANPSRLEAGQRMGGDGAGVVQSQFGGDATGGCPPAEAGLTDPRIEEDFGEPAAVVVAGAQEQNGLG